MQGTRGTIGKELARSLVAIREDRLRVLTDRLESWIGPFLAVALEELEVPPFPLPRLVIEREAGDVDLDIEGTSATLVAVDTNGGRPDWLCLLRGAVR